MKLTPRSLAYATSLSQRHLSAGQLFRPGLETGEPTLVGRACAKLPHSVAWRARMVPDWSVKSMESST